MAQISGDPLVVPDWAQAGLAEVTRLSDLLLAEQMSGNRSWGHEDQWWEVEVKVDYIDLSLNEQRQSVAGYSTVEATVQRRREELAFVRGSDTGWVVKMRQVLP